MIEIHIGNLYSAVNKKLATRQELETIHKALAVKVPGHYFVKSYRRGMWDGYKKFFNLLTGTFYTGLLEFLLTSIQEHNFQLTLVDERTHISHSNNPLSLEGIELRDYQIKMVEDAIGHERGIISAPPNAGKTEVACGIIKVLGLPANFFTHRLTLLHQTKERIEKRLGIEVGVVGGGELEIKTVNVLSPATVYKRLDDPIIKNLLTMTPVVISDECHRISSKTWEACLKACSGAYYRYGLSATALMRDEVSNMLVRGLTGSEIAGITNKELIDRGISAFPSVYLIGIHSSTIPSHYTFDQAYEEGILYNSERNIKVVRAAKRFLDQGKSVFILVWRIAHGDVLLTMLQDMGVEVEFIKGGGISESNLTNDAIKRFSKKTLKCLISSTISDEGLDVPAMDVLIMAVGFKAPSRVVQRVGRSLRKKVGENVVKIVDFVDFQNPRYLLKHSRDRMREYVKMDIDMYEITDFDKWEFVGV